jgi:hypothetical protein
MSRNSLNRKLERGHKIMAERYMYIGITVFNQKKLKAVVDFLIDRSTSFKVVPLPDDCWRVTYKCEHHGAVTDKFPILANDVEYSYLASMDQI